MSHVGERWRGTGKWALAFAVALAVSIASVPVASASLAAEDALTYIPNGFVHNTHSGEEIDEILGSLDSYGIGQVLLPMPKLKRDGTNKVPRKEGRMIPLWLQRVANYDVTHGSDEQLVGVFDGRVKGKSLNLEDPAVRANVVRSIEALVEQGLGGVQLDFEPYPTSPGFVTLLEEIDSSFARIGFHGRFSVCAPAHLATWSPAYMARVTSQLTQVDPLFYDSELTTPSAYEKWVRDGLAYYSANTASATRIIPVIPSYRTNRWHRPAVENIATATVALGEALQAGSRVQGAGIFWWWGFYYEEEGAYDPSFDQSSWSGTLQLPFAP